MNTQFMVNLRRWEVYSHLKALVRQDQIFPFNYHATEDKELEALTVDVPQLIWIKGRISDSFIGIIRLLPAGSKTLILFVNEDAVWHSPILKEGEELFEELYNRVNSHFAKAGLLATGANYDLEDKNQLTGIAKISPDSGEEVNELNGPAIEESGQGKLVTVDVDWIQGVRDVGNDREIIRLWREGNPTKEIGLRVNRKSSTITKKISELCKEYREKIVPYRRK